MEKLVEAISVNQIENLLQSHFAMKMKIRKNAYNWGQEWRADFYLSSWSYVD